MVIILKEPEVRALRELGVTQVSGAMVVSTKK